MNIKKPENKKHWNKYLLDKEASFTQSIEWGALKAKNQRVERLEARKNGRTVGVCQFLEEKNPFGKYFYVPYGPVGNSTRIRDNLIKKIADMAKREGKFAVKVEPWEKITMGKKTRHRIQPGKTLIKDITDSPKKILESFDEGTRYDVAYSKRKGVAIEKGKSEKNIKNFLNLLRKTQRRKKFESFSKRYFKNLLKTFDAELFLAVSKKGETIATTIFGYFGKTATSLHSGFDYKKRKLRATALIRFEAIKESKKRGCEKFDAWGIGEKKMPGVTKFKKGFGGKEVVYPPARDIALKKINYNGYRLAAKILRK